MEFNTGDIVRFWRHIDEGAVIWSGRVMGLLQRGDRDDDRIELQVDYVEHSVYILISDIVGIIVAEEYYRELIVKELRNEL